MFEKKVARPVGRIYRVEKTGGVPGWLVVLIGFLLLALIGK